MTDLSGEGTLGGAFVDASENDAVSYLCGFFAVAACVKNERTFT